MPVFAYRGLAVATGKQVSDVRDADNLKAKLALTGLEASVQTAAIPDRGTWHRVRVGPYRKVEEVNRAQAILKQQGIEAVLIRVNENATP